MQFLIKKIEIKFPAIKFFEILDHQTLDPDPGSAIIKNAGSGSVTGPSTWSCLGPFKFHQTATSRLSEVIFFQLKTVENLCSH